MAFLANPTARFQQYVAPDGTSSGPGSEAAPWETLDQGIAAVPTTCVAVGGQTGTIHLAGTEASPNTYVSIAGITVGGTLTIKSTEALGATVAGNGTSRAILLAAGANLTLEDIILDPSLNNGGAAAVGIDVPSTASVLDLTCTRVIFQNWTDRAILGTSNVRMNCRLTSCILNGGNVNGGVYLPGFADGDLVVESGSCTLTALKLDSTGGAIVVTGTTGGTATFNVTDFDTAITLDPTLVGAGVHYGLRALNIPASIVDGGTHSIGGTTAARTGACVLFDYSGPRNISGSQIKNATGVNGTNGGYVFAIGLEGSGTPAQAADCFIIDNEASATGAAIAGACHLAFAGGTLNCTIARNGLTDGGISVVDKENDGCLIFENVINGFSGSAIRIKGSANSNAHDNNVTQTAGYSGAIMIDLSWNDASSIPTTNAIVHANEFTNAGGSSTTMYVLDNHGGSSTPSNNVYNQSSGSLATNPWQCLGVNYTTLNAWKAIEPSATGTAP